MDQANLSPLLGRLDANIDELQDALEPLLKATLSQTATKLPLLDQAKLHVLVTYAIESILFSYLRLNGVDAKSHPVFRELTRVKQYFEKIKTVETASSSQKTPSMSLDKGAAERFINHALAGNVRFDLERAEQQAKEKAKAQVRSRKVHKKRKASDMNGEDDLQSSGSTNQKDE